MVLTQEKVRELFDYREDGKLVRKVSRGKWKVGEIAGEYMHSTGYRSINIGGKLYGTHRVIFLYHHGFLPEYSVDHRNRDKTDNKIENLRHITQQCNIRNSKISRKNTSSIKGVSWITSRRRWFVQIKVMNKPKYLGSFEDFTEGVSHRLAAEQCLNWEGCDSCSTAYQHMQKIKEKNNTYLD